MNALLLSLSLLTAQSETPEAAACRYALGQVESGGDDRAVGKAGERSRYQVLPSLWGHVVTWHEFGHLDPCKEEDAWIVMLAIFSDPRFIQADFKGSKFTPAALYAIWHRPERFRRSGYRLSGLTVRERERCRRFANLYAKKLAELKP